MESALGKSFAAAPLLSQHLPRAERGSYETVSAVDGIPRFAGYQAVRGLPLVVLVSFARAEVLAQWHRHIMIFGPLVAFFAATILVCTLLIVRQGRIEGEKSRILELKSRELELTNRRFDIALSNMPNGLCMWDKNQRLVISNNRYRDMYGLTPEQVRPGVFLREILQTHISNGETLDIDEQINIIISQTIQTHVLADGRTVSMRRQAMPDGGWIATHEDITEQKRAEALLRTTLDTMDQGLIAVDREGVAFLMNARVLDLLGLPAEFAVSRPHKDEILEYQRRTGEFNTEKQYSQVVNDIDQRRHVIYERERPNGTVLEIRTVPTEDGGFVRTYGDITARRAAEAALRRERDRAEAAARAATEFLANMSHELRTPLTAIIGVSDMLLSNSQSPERQRHFMELQRIAGQGLLEVINDILDFSKIEAGQLNIESEPLSLPEIAANCIDLVSDQAQRKALKVTAAIAEDIPEWVMGDAARLRQILLNLLANGVKFTLSGSVILAIEKVTGVPDAVRFSITDTGIGISEKNLATLFQRFAQGDSSSTRRFGGTGLGLAISKRLAALMGGGIDVKSEPGRGSTFAFTIRLTECHAINSVPEFPLPLQRRQAGHRILLAEDNPLNRELIKAMLEQAGNEVVTVNDGAEAVRVAVRNAFDAILMDVQMPEMDGYSATRAIRAAMHDAPELPIIALTASALSGEAERCLAAGMNVHVSKPVNWAALFATIDRLVDQGRRSMSPDVCAAVPPAGEHTRARNPEAFDARSLTELRSSIGDENAMRLLKLLAVEARQRFLSQPSSAETWEAALQEAHSFGGSAGMLGFEGLADACAALQSTESNDGELELRFDRCRRARDAALATIEELITEDRLEGRGRTTA